MSGISSLQRMTDAEVMLRVQAESAEAFEEIYERYYRKLQSFFYGLGRSGGHGDAQLAEDLCHETFMRLWRLRKRYEPSGRFAAYLFTIAHHIWRERLRATMKDRRLGVATSAESLEGIHLTANGLAPDDAAYYAEMDERILMALRDLPEEQRTAFVLRTIDGLSLEDIAHIMACPVNTVRSRRIIAIRRLREALSGLFVL